MNTKTDITLSSVANMVSTLSSTTSYSAKTARLALRTYGMPEKSAHDLLIEEIDLARDMYGLMFQGFYSPNLIELFGEQNVSEALSYCYHFMAEYEISFDFYNKVLHRLLESFKPEEIIAYPDKINMLIQSLRAQFKSNLSAEELEGHMEHYLEESSSELIIKMTLPLMDADEEPDYNDENDSE